MSALDSCGVDTGELLEVAARTGREGRDGRAKVIDRLTERREVVDVQTATVYEHVQSRCIEPAGADRSRTSRRSR
ncbi:hypothetical protein GCM10009525_13710 [Streptosporangium amethystogenes subsp. fukuiense]